MEEIWKDIAGYEGYYQVSSLGDVKTTGRYRIKRGYSHFYAEKILKKDLDNRSGYFMVTLYMEGVSRHVSIHRLVCSAFHENVENKPCVNHIDGIKTNNYPENLEWCTYSENLIHSFKTGLKSPTWLGKFGKDNPTSKSVSMFTMENEFIRSFGSSLEAQRETGVNNNSIRQCIRGRYRHAGNYIWK